MLVTKMRVLLDTNIWISGLLWGGTIRQIILLAESKENFLIFILLILKVNNEHLLLSINPTR